MALILGGGLAPIVIALAVWMWAQHRLLAREAACDHGGDLVAAAPAASLWAGLTEEIARRDTRRPPRRSVPVARQRHLAAVLPADARR